MNISRRTFLKGALATAVTIPLVAHMTPATSAPQITMQFPRGKLDIQPGDSFTLDEGTHPVTFEFKVRGHEVAEGNIPCEPSARGVVRAVNSSPISLCARKPWFKNEVHFCHAHSRSWYA